MRLEIMEGASMGDLLQPWHLIVLAVIAFLLFGVRRLPELGKGMGEGIRSFREGIRGIFDPLPTVTAQQNSSFAPSLASNDPREPEQK